MGKLFDYKTLIDQKTRGLGKEEFKIKGQIGLKSGVFVGSITETTADDLASVEALKKAIKEILGVSV